MHPQAPGMMPGRWITPGCSAAQLPLADALAEYRRALAGADSWMLGTIHRAAGSCRAVDAVVRERHDGRAGPQRDRPRAHGRGCAGSASVQHARRNQHVRVAHDRMPALVERHYHLAREDVSRRAFTVHWRWASERRRETTSTLSRGISCGQGPHGRPCARRVSRSPRPGRLNRVKPGTWACPSRRPRVCPRHSWSLSLSDEIGPNPPRCTGSST